MRRPRMVPLTPTSVTSADLILTKHDDSRLSLYTPDGALGTFISVGEAWAAVDNIDLHSAAQPGTDVDIQAA